MDKLPIIFLHGILNNRPEGWRAEGAALGWPEIAAADPQLADCEVLALTYETGVVSTNLNLKEIGRNLWLRIRDRGFHSRPALIILGYSMGGIIARQMLVDHLDELGERTVVGLLLVGSPSRGSGWAHLVAPLARVLGHDQAMALRATGNGFLDELYDDFARLMRKRPVVGLNLREQYNMILRPLPPIVSRKSAQAHFDPYTIEGSDHSSICKPASAEAAQHGHLRRLVEDVRRKVAAERAVHQVADFAALLAGSGKAEAVAAAGIDAGVIVALAQRVAPEVADPREALGVIEALADERIRLRAEAAEGSNLGGLVDAAVKAIDARTEAGDFEAAAAEADAFVARWEAEEAARAAERAEAGRKLIDEAIAARLRIPDVPGAAALVARRCALDADPEAAREAAWLDWHLRGGQSGLRPQLRLARAIAEGALADTPDGSFGRVVWGNNLATTLREIGTKEMGEATLEAARAVLDAAEAEARAGGFDDALALTLANRASVATFLAQRRRDRGHAEAAVKAAEAAVALFRKLDRAELAGNLATAWSELGNACFVLGSEVGADAAVLARAVEAFTQAERARPTDAPAIQRAIDGNNRANALWALGRLQGDAATVRAAVDHYGASIATYVAEGAGYLRAQSLENRAEAKETLASLVPAERDGRLAAALADARAAVAAYEAVGATFDVESARRVAERIEAARAG